MPGSRYNGPVPPNDPKKPGSAGPRRQDALGNKIPDPSEELMLIEKELNDLKVLFEQYFLGLGKTPVRRKDLLGEKIRRLKSSGVVRNTAQKFKLEQMQSKYGTFDRMWARTIQEMEAGTYRRDLFKLKHRQALRAEPADAEPPPVAARPAPADNALSDGQIRALYDTYLMARQRTGESVQGITFDGLAATLKKQVPTLMQKHDCKAIDFKVVIKDGKALLKAVPRK